MNMTALRLVHSVTSSELNKRKTRRYERSMPRSLEGSRRSLGSPLDKLRARQPHVAEVVDQLVLDLLQESLCNS